jgi:hypothetical protein
VDPQPLTAEQAVEEGGWNASFARVLKLEDRGDVAFPRIDTNGDGDEVEDTFFIWQGDRWVELGSNGWGTSSLAGWASGTASNSEYVSVDYAGQRFLIPVDGNGDWWFVGRVASSSTDDWPDLPRLVTPSEGT